MRRRGGGVRLGRVVIVRGVNGLDVEGGLRHVRFGIRSHSGVSFVWTIFFFCCLDFLATTQVCYFLEKFAGSGLERRRFIRQGRRSSDGGRSPGNLTASFALQTGNEHDVGPPLLALIFQNV